MAGAEAEKAVFEIDVGGLAHLKAVATEQFSRHLEELDVDEALIAVRSLIAKEVQTGERAMEAADISAPDVLSSTELDGVEATYRIVDRGLQAFSEVEQKELIIRVTRYWRGWHVLFNRRPKTIREIPFRSKTLDT
jgi:hypothetical protein